MKHDPGKNPSKVVAKVRENSQASKTRRHESGPKQPQVMTAKMVDRKHAETFQVGSARPIMYRAIDGTRLKRRIPILYSAIPM